jgi:hypothetical protein
MKTEDLVAMYQGRVPGQPAMVRHPDFPTERFEVISVAATGAAITDPSLGVPAEAEIASRWRSLTADVAVLEPWFPPKYEQLLDAARLTLTLAAEAAPDWLPTRWHRTKLHLMAETLNAMHRETVASRQHEEEAAR